METSSDESLEGSLADERLEDLLDQWEELRERGEEFDLQRLNALAPSLADAFLRAVDDLKQFEAFDSDAAPENDGGDPPRIGPYLVEQRLAEGGSSVVYACRQSVPNRLVAVKLMRPDAVSARRIRRFRIEAELLATLSHPGIVQVHEAGVVRLGTIPQPYICMEFIRGQRLDEAFPAGVFTENDRCRRLLNLFAQIAEALHFAHQHGVIHRDLKPSNILVDEEGRPKIIDFGIARLRTSETATDEQETITRSPVGTPPYMSPEQFQEDFGLVDARSDLYGLAVVLFKLLTGTLPYDLGGKPYVEMARIIRETVPTPLRRIDRRFGRDLEAVVQTALAKAPGERYQSAGEFAADLRRVTLGQPVKAVRAGPMRQLWMWGRRHPKAAILSSLIAVLLTTSVVVSTLSASWAINQSRALKASMIDLRREQDRSLQLTVDLTDRNEELKRKNERLVESADVLQRTATNATLLRAGLLIDSDPTLARALLFDDVACPPRLRGMAWNLVERQTRRDTVEFQAAGSPLTDVYRLAFAAKGTTLVTLTPHRIRWRNSRDGGLTHSLTDRIDGRSRLAVDPLGDLAVVLRLDGTVFAVSPSTQRQPLTWDATASLGTAVACAPGSRFIAVGDASGSVRVWDEDLQSPPQHWKLDDSPIVVLAFSSDGKRCAAISRNGAVEVRDSQGSSNIERGKFPARQVTGGTFDGELRLVSGTVRGAVIVWNRVESRIVSTEPEARATTFTSNNPAELFTAARSHVHRIRNDGARSLFHAHDSLVLSLAAAPDGSRIAIGRANGTTTILTTTSSIDSLMLSPIPKLPYLARYSPNGRRLAIAGQEEDATHSLRVFRLTENTLEAEYLGITSRIDDIAFSRDGRTLVMSTVYGPAHVQVFNAESGDPGRPIETPDGRVTSLALTKDGRHLYAGARSGAVYVFDLHSGELLATFEKATKNCRAIQLFQDDRRLLSTHGGGEICCWNTETRELDWKFNSGIQSIGEIALSPDERLLAIAPQRGSYTVFRIRDQGIERLADLSSDSSRQTSLSFSPDGAVLAAGDLSGQLQVWDAATWQPQLAWSRPNRPLHCVRFSPDGRYLSICSQHDLSHWRLPP